jgi:glutamine phosphoribosylpyrophosphate amidotransferase
MCEHYIARAAEPFALRELWPFTDRLERYGLAGFGWGAAWIAEDGGLRSHRDVRAFRDDHEGGMAVGMERTTAALVHLRRPSKLSTLALPDTQPFDDPRGRFSFSHNGDLRDYRPLRREYQAQGRIHGRADTEVGARWLEDAWRPDAAVGPVLHELHDRFGGQANLAVLTVQGDPWHYAGNSENPVFSFRLGAIGVVSTGIYSLDRSLFAFVAPDATARRLVRAGTTVTLDRDGTVMASA